MTDDDLIWEKFLLSHCERGGMCAMVSDPQFLLFKKT